MEYLYLWVGSYVRAWSQEKIHHDGQLRLKHEPELSQYADGY
jgi:hypothetical protein